MTENLPQDGSTPQTGILDWVVSNYLGSKIQAQHIRNYAGANLALNHGRDIAKKLGLDPAQITPFPCPTNISVNQELPPASPPQSQPAMSMLAKAGIAAALVGAGAGVAPVAGWLSDLVSEKNEVVLPAEEEANVGFEIR